MCFIFKIVKGFWTLLSIEFSRALQSREGVKSFFSFFFKFKFDFCLPSMACVEEEMRSSSIVASGEEMRSSTLVASG